MATGSHMFGKIKAVFRARHIGIREHSPDVRRHTEGTNRLQYISSLDHVETCVDQRDRP